jgi:hypothetical protein
MGQPVALINTDEGLRVGVMSLINPDADDYFYNPVPLKSLGTLPEVRSDEQ